MKRGERNPNCTFSGAETDKNAPCLKVSVKLVIINKRPRFCLVLSRFSRATFSQEEKIPPRRESANGCVAQTRRPRGLALSLDFQASSQGFQTLFRRVLQHHASALRGGPQGRRSPRRTGSYRKFIASIRGSVISSIA
jgi:hypothetical protein